MEISLYSPSHSENDSSDSYQLLKLSKERSKDATTSKNISPNKKEIKNVSIT